MQDIIDKEYKDFILAKKAIVELMKKLNINPKTAFSILSLLVFELCILLEIKEDKFVEFMKDMFKSEEYKNIAKEIDDLKVSLFFCKVCGESNERCRCDHLK